MVQNRKNRGVIIFGAGGHAKSVISIIEAEAKWKIHGLYDDDNAAMKGRKVADRRSLCSPAS